MDFREATFESINYLNFQDKKSNCYGQAYFLPPGILRVLPITWLVSMKKMKSLLLYIRLKGTFILMLVLL